ncbi:hypothetical protein HIM_09391 [Hirsutella minnesotensis 3608]|uniref:Uncharacterized protein n=1 Tax=Hirsutella minnesotensis 3608 TaxID=1043627 RepID=A0A0F7ZSF0_9HYPO|nr:hypothetical protein HIM_09391 [Hirsutella minnesotensis 3608]
MKFSATFLLLAGVATAAPISNDLLRREPIDEAKVKKGPSLNEQLGAWFAPIPGPSIITGTFGGGITPAGGRLPSGGSGRLGGSGRPGSSGSGRPGSSGSQPGTSRGPGAASQSRSPDFQLADYRPSDRAIASQYVRSGSSGKVKAFDGGRGAAEKELFSSIKNRYTDLKEVDAVNSGVGNYASQQRGADRYIFGTPKDDPSKGSTMLGVARHAPNGNSFDRFKPFPGT